MVFEVKKVAIMPNVQKDTELAHTKEVIDTLTKLGVNIVLPIDDKIQIDNVEYREPHNLLNDVEMLIVLGGDGTILTTARETAGAGVPILGLNLGHLGFLAELEKHNLSFFKNIVDGACKIDSRMMLDASIGCESDLMRFKALNDIVVSRGSLSRILHINVYFDDEFVNRYLADGIIVSTPTGSTAYSLSAGGPIVEPSMDLIVVTPICPHALHSRSIIAPADKTVRIVVDNPTQHEAMLTVDGQEGKLIEENDVVIIKKAAERTRLIRMTDHSFYNTLRQKLSERQ